jgi:hypothetical protein
VHIFEENKLAEVILKRRSELGDELYFIFIFYFLCFLKVINIENEQL